MAELGKHRKTQEKDIEIEFQNTFISVSAVTTALFPNVFPNIFLSYDTRLSPGIEATWRALSLAVPTTLSARKVENVHAQTAVLFLYVAPFVLANMASTDTSYSTAARPARKATGSSIRLIADQS